MFLLLRTTGWVFVVVFGLSAAAAEASVIGLNVTPSFRNVAIGQTATVTVTWTVVNSLVTPSSTSTVTSDASSNATTLTAAFVPSCTLTPPFILGIPTNPVLTSTVPTGGATTVTQTIVDTEIISAQLIQQGRNAGLSTIYYLRRFYVPPPAEATDPGRFACVALNITGSAAASFSVSREALSFDNGAPVSIVSRNHKLQAQANISYTGTGLLQGVWEVAEPPSTSGQPVYRVLSQVQRSLIVSEAVTIKSPNLPTDLTGFYLLRLSITDPVPGFEAPVIRYFVGEGRPGKGLPAQPFALGSPPPAAILASDTGFSWEPMEGARAYELEVYATGRESDLILPDLGSSERTPPSTTDVAQALSRPPVTGMLVPGRQTQTNLSAAARVHLQPGRTYLWRVLAIGEDGSVIGQSPMRELRTP